MRSGVGPCPRVWLAALAFCACGEAQQYAFRYYGTEQGLNNLSAQVLLQDHAGFLWVGTQNGLYRYQGLSFVEFGTKDGLPSEYIECLHETPDGVLWVGTPAGLFQSAGGRFVATGLTGIGVNSIASDGQGRLYVATKQGLWMGDWRAPAQRGFYLAGLQRKTEVDDVFVTPDGAAWFQCGTGVCRIRGGAIEVFGVKEGLAEEDWEGFAQDRRGSLWVRSEDSLAMLRAGGHSFELVKTPRPIKSATKRRMTFDRVGRLFIPTLDGVVIRDEGGRWQSLGTSEGLSAEQVTQVLEDREGSIWLTLLGGGVARWLGRGTWTSFTERQGLTGRTVWAITRDGRGRMWVGTNKGLFEEDSSSGRSVWRKSPVSSDRMVRSIARDRTGALWVASGNRQLLRFDPATGATAHLTGDQGVPGGRLNGAFADSSGAVWLLSADGVRRSAAGGSAALFRPVPGMIQAGTCDVMREPRPSEYWIACEKGLLHGEGGNWQLIDHKQGLLDDWVESLACAKNGEIWLGYHGAFGVTRLVLEGGRPRMRHFNRASGLKSDLVYALFFDTLGQLVGSPGTELEFAL